MRTRNFLGMFVAALLGGFVSLFVYSKYINPAKVVISADQAGQAHLASYAEGGGNQVDFTVAAERSIHAVVHIITKQMRNQAYANPFLDFFFGYGIDVKPQPVAGFGSGVIISADGYIVTNNHVVDGADEIEVNLNDKRSFKAKVIGRDPDTDLAVIKIEGKELPYISYGNSDELKVGEWVLAVGNPFNLTSSVTAGIVSAKARNLSLLAGSNGNHRTNPGIESFIQTDAAINPGNSGGALVNTHGELVGINTLIYSQTGNYSGSSFAIPVTIVKKVVADLVEFGKVQRALLGVSISDLTSDLAREKGIDKIEGVYIGAVIKNGAAEASGIKVGDVVISINEVKVNSTSELQEQVSRFRPNDKINVLIKRDNKEKQITLTLRNIDGNTKITSGDDLLAKLGGVYSELTANEKHKLGLVTGVKLADIGDGKLHDEGVLKGFIITRMNNRPVSSVDDISSILNSAKGVIYLEGIYPNGVVAYYTISMD